MNASCVRALHSRALWSPQSLPKIWSGFRFGSCDGDGLAAADDLEKAHQRLKPFLHSLCIPLPHCCGLRTHCSDQVDLIIQNNEILIEIRLAAESSGLQRIYHIFTHFSVNPRTHARTLFQFTRGVAEGVLSNYKCSSPGLCTVSKTVSSILDDQFLRYSVAPSPNRIDRRE